MLDKVLVLHVSIIWACFCRCLNLLYCCFSADISTVSLSLSTFCWEGPALLPLNGICCPVGLGCCELLFGTDPDVWEDFPEGDLNTADIPNDAATAIFSSSSSILSSSSLVKYYRDLKY